MTSIAVEPVTTHGQRQAFIRLPWAIYRGDPCWVPPLLVNHKEMLGYTHSPFYDEAEIQTFLAVRDGVPQGRIAAIINHGHNRRFQERRGFFGFFECENNPETARALFSAAQHWLGERTITAVRGPANPSLNHECGLLVEGFDSPPTFMNTYNPRYYSGLIEACGFRKSQDLYAFTQRVDSLLELAAQRRSFVQLCMKRMNLRFRPVNMRNFRADVQMFLEMLNRAYAKVWGFVPLSAAEISHMAKGFKALIVPELTTIAEIDGRPIAAIFALLDYNPRIQAIDGRLFPFGFIRLLANRRGIKRMRVISAQVEPEYQLKGLAPLMVDHMLPALQAWGIHEVEFSTVVESNRLSCATLRHVGASITKVFRMYDRDACGTDPG